MKTELPDKIALKTETWDMGTILGVSSLVLGVLNFIVVILFFIVKWYYDNPKVQCFTEFNHNISVKNRQGIENWVLHPKLEKRRLRTDEMIYIGWREIRTTVKTNETDIIDEDSEKLFKGWHHRFKYSESIIYIPFSLEKDLPKKIKSMIILSKRKKVEKKG